MALVLPPERLATSVRQPFYGQQWDWLLPSYSTTWGAERDAQEGFTKIIYTLLRTYSQHRIDRNNDRSHDRAVQRKSPAWRRGALNGDIGAGGLGAAVRL